MRILKHECMDCAKKHLASAMVLEGVHQLGHLCCALNHSGIEAVNEQINNWWNNKPVIIEPIINNLKLDDEFQGYARRGVRYSHSIQECLAIAPIIAIEISQGYKTEEYIVALLGNLSIAGDFASTIDIDFGNKIRNLRLDIFPNNHSITGISERLIKELFNLSEECLRLNGKVKIKPMKLVNYKGATGTISKVKKSGCGGCGKKGIVNKNAKINKNHKQERP